MQFQYKIHDLSDYDLSLWLRKNGAQQEARCLGGIATYVNQNEIIIATVEYDSRHGERTIHLMSDECLARLE